jgi:uncharacterized protein YhbP (UPF0306 family)
MLYNLKKSAEAFYFKHCIKQGKLPLPDTVYYLWDRKKLNNIMLITNDKERSPRKEKKKLKKKKSK